MEVAKVTAAVRELKKRREEGQPQRRGNPTRRKRHLEMPRRRMTNLRRPTAFMSELAGVRPLTVIAWPKEYAVICLAIFPNPM